MRPLRVILFLMLLAPFALVGVAGGANPEPVSSGGAVVALVRLEDEPITPVTARFLQRAHAEADALGAQCLIIELDTPGGLVDATRTVVKDLLASERPVVVYVAPESARAASAGVFITMSAHVAAMAPGTHIGAAHPVQIGGLPIGPAPSPTTPTPTPDGPDSGDQQSKDTPPQPARSATEEKIVQDTVAWARALAELRGRNVEWAKLAVAESRSITSSEALELGVIDLIAADLDDLLAQIDGREVACAGGTVRLDTAHANVREIEMWWGEQLLAVISNPNVAVLLMVFGFYGILFEFYSPGWGVAGTLGVICLLLAFFGMAVLPINHVGLALILAALALFVAEAFVVSFGALTVGGIVCLILGGLMLVDSPPGFLRVSLAVLVPIAVSTALITLFLVGNIVKTHRLPVYTGDQGLEDAEAEALDDFAPVDGHYRGTVRIHGELWTALGPEPVSAGQRVTVQRREGLSLLVRPKGPTTRAGSIGSA